ncbi:MAG: hypothetical protein WBG43_10455 [Marinifilaceae bacterium]
MKKNKGIAGVDNVSVYEFKDWYDQNGLSLTESILTGTYIPAAVKLVSIPKSNGG